MLKNVKFEIRSIAFLIMIAFLASMLACGLSLIGKYETVQAQSSDSAEVTQQVQPEQIDPTGATNKYFICYYNGSEMIEMVEYTKGTASNLKSWANLGATVLYSTYGWAFYGWATSTTSYAIEYTNSQSVTLSPTTLRIDLFAVYSRTVSFYNQNTTTPVTKTQYWNPCSQVDTNISAVEAPVLKDLSGYTKRGYRHDTTAGSALYVVTSAAANIVPIINKAPTLYGVYSKIKIFQSGVDVSGAATTYRNISGSESVKETAELGSDWTFLGYRADTTATSPTYIYDELTPSVSTNNKLYAIYSREIYIVYISGENAASVSARSATQYVNANNKTVSTVTVDYVNPVSVGTGWNFRGYSLKKDNTFSNLITSAYAQTPAYTETKNCTVYYALYARDFTVTFHSGMGSTAKSVEVNASTTYYNSAAASVSSTVSSITLDDATKCAAISNWTKSGWRTDTTANAKTYDFGQTITGSLSFSLTDFYAVYTRTLTATYNANGGSGSITSLQKTIYLNSGTTTTSNQTLTLSENKESGEHFTRTGYTFNNWRIGTTGSTYVTAGGTYNPQYAYSATSFTVQVYAQWTPNPYYIAYYNGTDVLGTVEHVYDTPQNLKLWSAFGATILNNGMGWNFYGWATANNTTTRSYTDGQEVKNITEAGTVSFYALYSRTITYKSGVAGATTKTATQIWNTYGTSDNNVGLVEALKPTDITNWQTLGYRQDKTASTASFAVTATMNIRPAVNASNTLYAVYKRDYSATFYSGVNKASQQVKVAAATTYYNSSAASLPTVAASITLALSTQCTGIDGWNAIGWRDDTTTGNKEYDFGASKNNIAFGTNFYAVYARAYTANFYSGNEGKFTAVQASITYYNTNTTTVPTTVSSITMPAITAISNWESKFWRADTQPSISGSVYGITTYTNTIPFNTTTFYAVYARTLTITYNGNGATSGATTNSTKEVYLNTYNLTLSSLTFPSLATPGFHKTGSTFLGWSETTTGNVISGEYTPTVAYNAATFGKTLYAKWQANQYSVTINANGGTYNDQASVTQSKSFGSSITLSNPTRAGYAFKGWAITKTFNLNTYVLVLYHDNQSGAVLFTENLATTKLNTLTKYSLLNYLDEELFYNNQYSFALEYPQISSTYFNTWSQTTNPVTSTTISGYTIDHLDYSTNFNGLAKTSYAGFISSHGNKYFSIGETTARTEGGLTGIYGPSGIMQDTVRLWVQQSQDLSSINLENLGETALLTDSSFIFRDFDATVTAIWEPQTYTISFDTQSADSTFNPIEYTVSPQAQTINIPTPTRTGYSFSKWNFTQNTQGSSSATNLVNQTQYVIEIPANAYGAIILKAQWEAIKYYLSYYNGSTSTQAYKTDTLTYDVEYQLASFNQSIENSTYGWKFYGWATANNSTERIYTDAQSGIKNLTTEPNAYINIYAIYERDCVIKSGSAGASENKTQYWNSKSYADNNISGITVNAPTAISGWTALGYVQGDATSEPNFAVTSQKSIKPDPKSSQNINAVYSRTLTFKSAVNTQSSDGEKTQHLNSNGNKVSAVEAPTPADIGHSWQRLGYRADTTATSQTYAFNASISPAYNTANILYATYSRTITDIYKSGINLSQSTSKTAVQYYNSKGNISSATPAYVAPKTIDKWTFIGYVTNTTASAALAESSITAAVAKNPAVESDSITTEYYAIYSRGFSAKFHVHATWNSSTSFTTITSDLTYYNSAMSALPTNVAKVIMPAASYVDDISGWTKIGFRLDKSASTAVYNFGQECTNIPFEASNGDAPEFYAVFSRVLTIKYNGNGQNSGETPDTTKTIYLNINSQTTSSQSVTLAENGFKKIGHKFSKWIYDTEGYEEGKSFNPNLAYNETFAIEMEAEWLVNTYYLRLDLNFDTVYETIENDTTHTYYDGTYDGNVLQKDLKYNEAFPINHTPQRPGYEFMGWALNAFEPGDLEDNPTFSYGTYSLFGKPSNGKTEGGVDIASYQNPDFSLAGNTNDITGYNGGAVAQIAAFGYGEEYLKTPSISNYQLKVTSNGSDQGFSMPFYNETHASKIFYVFYALIPEGKTLAASGSPTWLTSTAGTGTWELYVCSYTNMSGVGNFYLSGSQSNALWYLAYANCFDATGIQSGLFTGPSSLTGALGFTCGANSASFTAMWKPIKYNITYDENGGSTIADNNYYISGYIEVQGEAEGQRISIPQTTKAGYTFAGWEFASESENRGVILYNDYRDVQILISNNYQGTNTMIIPAHTYGNIALKAKWLANNYTVTLNNSQHGGVNAVTFTKKTSFNTGVVMDYSINFAISGSFSAAAVNDGNVYSIISNQSTSGLTRNTFALQISADGKLEFILYEQNGENDDQCVYAQSSTVLSPSTMYAYTIIYNHITKTISLKVIQSANQISFVSAKEGDNNAAWNGSYTFTTEFVKGENAVSSSAFVIGSESDSFGPITVGALSFYQDNVQTHLFEPYNQTKLRNAIDGNTRTISGTGTLSFPTMQGYATAVAVYGEDMPKISIPVHTQEDMFNGYYDIVDQETFMPTNNSVEYISASNESATTYNHTTDISIQVSWKPSYASLQYYSKTYYANLADAFDAANNLAASLIAEDANIEVPVFTIQTLKLFQHVASTIEVDHYTKINLTSKVKTIIIPSVEEGKTFDTSATSLFMVQGELNISGGSPTNNITITNSKLNGTKQLNSSLIKVNGKLTLGDNLILGGTAGSAEDPILKITVNYGNNEVSGNGGAVYVGQTAQEYDYEGKAYSELSPVLNISGADICYNVSSRGAGVYANKGVVNFTSGSIHNNTAEVYGSGVYMSDDTTLNMSGGSITNNLLPASDENAPEGRKFTSTALYAKNASINVSGGSITANKQNSLNVAITVDGGSLTNGVVSGNSTNGGIINDGIEVRTSAVIKLIGGTTSSYINNNDGTIQIGGAATIANGFKVNKVSKTTGMIEILDNLSNTDISTIQLTGSTEAKVEDTSYVKFATSLSNQSGFKVQNYIAKFSFDNDFSLYADETNKLIKIAKKYTFTFSKTAFAAGKNISNLNVTRSTCKVTGAPTALVINSVASSGTDRVVGNITYVDIYGIYINDVLTITYTTQDGYNSRLIITNNGVDEIDVTNIGKNNTTTPTISEDVTAKGNISISVTAVQNGYYVAFNKNFNVTVDNDGVANLTDIDSPMSNQDFEYGVKENLNTAFTRPGYRFLGWSKTPTGTVDYTDGQAVEKLTTELHGTVTLYALWEALEYNLKITAENGAVVTLQKASTSNGTYTDFPYDENTKVKTDDHIKITLSVADSENFTLLRASITKTTKESVSETALQVDKLTSYTTKIRVQQVNGSNDEIAGNIHPGTSESGDEYLGIYVKAVMNIGALDSTKGATVTYTKGPALNQITITSFSTTQTGDIDLVIPNTVSIDSNQKLVRGDEYNMFVISGSTVDGTYKGAFEGNTKITSATIPGSVAVIGEQAFQGCTRLETLTFTEGLTLIDNNAFNGCTALTTIELPKTLTNIDINAFYGCASLEKITFKNDTDVGDSAFADLATLEAKTRTLYIDDADMASKIGMPGTGTYTYGNVLTNVHTIYSVVKLQQADTLAIFSDPESGPQQVTNSETGKTYYKYVRHAGYYQDGTTLYVYDSTDTKYGNDVTEVGVNLANWEVQTIYAVNIAEGTYLYSYLNSNSAYTKQATSDKAAQGFEIKYTKNS